MDRGSAVLRSYMDGRTGLDGAADELLTWWKDHASGGWGLYLDASLFTPDDLTRARTLEHRFNDLVELHTRRRPSGGSD